MTIATNSKRRLRLNKFLMIKQCSLLLLGRSQGFMSHNLADTPKNEQKHVKIVKNRDFKMPGASSNFKISQKYFYGISFMWNGTD